MLNVLRRGHAAFQTETPGPGWRPGDDVIWIDLLKPTREEELAVEAALGLELPTIEEMEALEPSSRLYQEAGATFMTATLLARGDEAMPSATPATFVLAHGRLITLRYEQLRAYAVYSGRRPRARRDQRRRRPAGPAGRHRRAPRADPRRLQRPRRGRLAGGVQAPARAATSARC
jgi:magnesium transporter